MAASSAPARREAMTWQVMATHPAAAETAAIDQRGHAMTTLRTADGTPLFVRDWPAQGRARGTLVFLAGWTLSSDAWAYQMAPLARQGFRCVAFDRRAHGRSDDPGRGLDFDTLADDLATALECLDVRDACLVAHSFASGEAVRCLTRHGRGRVARVLLLAPAAIPYLRRSEDNPHGLPQAAIDAHLAALEADFPGWIEANAAPYFGAAGTRALIDWTARDMTRTSLQATLELARLQLHTDFRAELARIDVPVLIVHGTADASAPIELTGRPAAALIPGARLVEIDGAPHGLYVTHRERVNAEIAAFACESSP
jgi:pimeloyl-ACP methyl ester carboxylesterase